MKYFNNLPTIRVIDSKGHSKSYKNIMTRLSIIPSILENPLLYYSYDLKESDTPEIVADKYYGDSYRYWIVLFSNQILDPQWDWPLSYSNFNNYINDKYTSNGIDPYTTIRSYLKTTTIQNTSYQTTNVISVEISENDYQNSVPVSGTTNISNEIVNYSITYSAQSYYDYEMNLNESKRNIKILNKDYLPQIQKEFVNLVS